MAKIPGLRAAVERAQFARAVDFLAMPEKIDGIVVRPLRVRDLGTLQAIDSPFLNVRPPKDEFVKWQAENAEKLAALHPAMRELVIKLEGRPVPTDDDVVNFLWLLRPEYEPCRLSRRWFYLRHCRKHDPRQLVPAIYAFIDHTFADITGAGGNDGPAAYSTAAAFIDLFGSEYGWPKNETLELGVREALQLRNRIFERRANKRIAVSTREEMEAKQRWLDERNAIPERN